MPDQKERRTLVILNLLGLYILLQVCWWGYSLVDVNHRLSDLQGNGPGNHRALWMIVGEGSVFVILLSAGFWRIRRDVRRELRFARMQRTFLLAVTHELKTPVAAIKLMLETLHTRDISPTQSARLVADALKESNRLEGLTGNILLTTRLGHGKQDHFSERINFSALAGSESSRFEQLFESHRTFRLRIDPDLYVDGENELLRSLCFNLIDNAVKYSPAGGLIDISLKCREKTIVLRVADQGIGIPDSEKKRVFEKFYRPGDEQIRRHKGTGLGLYIVYWACRLHGGSIRIEDNQPAGTVFHVELPLSHAN